MVRLWFLLFFLVSCSPIQTIEGLRGYSASLKGIFEDGGLGWEDYSPSPCRNYNASITGRDFEPPERDDYGQLQLEYPQPVREEIRHFTETVKGREFMERALERSTRYAPLMLHIIRQGELPELLLYVALVESGFDCRIESSRGALGCWQFMEATAKDSNILGDERLPMHEGLIDGRLDPELSTRAAVKYMQYLYDSLGPDWHMALAGYNAGPRKMSNLRVHTGSRNFFEIIGKLNLDKEIEKHVPRIIAAIAIVKDLDYYGFSYLNFQSPLEFDVIKRPKRLNRFEDIANEYGHSHSELRELNPMFKTDFIPESISYIRVPCRADDPI